MADRLAWVRSPPSPTALTASIARRQGATRSGAFLDPLADKVVVLASMYALCATGRLPWLPVVLITAREVWMSVYRSRASSRGLSIPARQSAKIKTLVQDFAIAWCVLPPTATPHAASVS